MTKNRLLASIASDAQKGDQASIDAVNEQAQRGGAIGEQAREAQKQLPPVQPEA